MAYRNKADAIRYNNDYIAKSYDRINLTVPKGRKAEIQEAARRKGQKVNTYLNNLIDAALERDDIAGGGSGFGGQSEDDI